MFSNLYTKFTGQQIDGSGDKMSSPMKKTTSMGGGKSPFQKAGELIRRKMSSGDGNEIFGDSDCAQQVDRYQQLQI